MPTVAVFDQQQTSDKKISNLSAALLPAVPAQLPRRELSVNAQGFIPPHEREFQQVHNIHYNVALKNQVPFVPYTTNFSFFDLPRSQQGRNQFRDLIPGMFKFTSKRYNNFPNPVTLYIGGLGLTPTHNVVWNLLSCIGIIPLRVAIDKIKKNHNNRIVSPMCMIEVKSMEDARKAIACLDRRVLLDQTGFYLAQTHSQVEVLARYCSMLKSFKDNCKGDKEVEARSPTFIHRPHRLVTVSLEGRIHDNEQNPLCQCDSCTNFFQSFADYSYINDTYIPFTYQIFGCDFSDLRFKLILTHAFRDANTLSAIEDEVYCDVSDETLFHCRELVENYWCAWQHKDLALKKSSGCKNKGAATSNQ